MARAPRGRISTATAAKGAAQVRREFQRRVAEEAPIVPSQLDDRIFQVEQDGRVCLIAQPAMLPVIDQSGGKVQGRFLPPVAEVDDAAGAGAATLTGSSTTTEIATAVNLINANTATNAALMNEAVESILALRDAAATLAKMHNEMLSTLQRKGLLERVEGR